MATDKGQRLTLHSLSEQLEHMSGTLNARMGRLDERLEPIQENVATLNAAVSTLVGLDGVAQELADLVEIAGTALSVLGPPAPPRPGVTSAIESLTKATSPALALEQLQLDDFASPYIGEPRLYVTLTTGRTT